MGCEGEKRGERMEERREASKGIERMLFLTGGEKIALGVRTQADSKPRKKPTPHAQKTRNGADGLPRTLRKIPTNEGLLELCAFEGRQTPYFRAFSGF